MTLLATRAPASGHASLAPITLAELVERSALQTRVDRKYVVSPSMADDLIAVAPEGTRALEINGQRTFDYTSAYLDTPDLLAFHLAARRRRRRFKVRTRLYDASGLRHLEVKTRDGAHTIKTRLPGDHVGDQCGDPVLSVAGATFVTQTLHAAGIDAGVVTALRPVLRTHYRRTTLHLEDDASRVTIDRDLHWLDLVGGATIARPDLVVIETKSAGAASPMDRVLWRRGIRPTRISKYATGLASLTPTLPHNRWARTLRRHF